MFSLIRFFEEKEYVEQFLDGDLYMNSIGHFQAIEEDKPQNDAKEGVVETISVEGFSKKYGSEFSEPFSDHILFPIKNRLEEYKYVHVLCFMMHEYDLKDREVLEIDSKMRGMGGYAVRINNVQKFVDLLFNRLKKEKYYGLMGPMNYHDASDECSYRDCFDKNSRYSHEKEWRFALIPDYESAKRLAAEDVDGSACYDCSYTFSVGDLRDIAEEIDVQTLMSDPGSLYMDSNGKRLKSVKSMKTSTDVKKRELENMINGGLGKGIPYDAFPWQYVGWSPREAFRDKVIELGGKIKPIMTVGADRPKTQSDTQRDLR